MFGLASQPASVSSLSGWSGVSLIASVSLDPESFESIEAESFESLSASGLPESESFESPRLYSSRGTKSVQLTANNSALATALANRIFTLA